MNKATFKELQSNYFDCGFAFYEIYLETQW